MAKCTAPEKYIAEERLFILSNNTHPFFHVVAVIPGLFLKDVGEGKQEEPIWTCEDRQRCNFIYYTIAPQSCHLAPLTKIEPFLCSAVPSAASKKDYNDRPLFLYMCAVSFCHKAAPRCRKIIASGGGFMAVVRICSSGSFYL